MNYPYYSTRLFTFLLFILSFGLSQAQQGTEFARVFNKHVLPDDGEEGPSVVITADINGDGHMDIVTASRYDATVRWFENDGSDGFTVHTVATHKGGVDSLIVDDVDGDGLLDIASLGWSSALTWYEQQRDASGNVSFVEDYAHSHKRSQGLFAADVNGDGRLDFLTTAEHSEHYWGDEVRWYENNGAGDFTEHVISQIAGAGPIIAADFDGDGNIDVVTSAIAIENRAIYLFKNDGEENFTSQLIDDDQTFQPNLLSLVDLDGDGNMDFLAGSTSIGVAGGTTTTLYWYKNDGAGNFSKNDIYTAFGGLRRFTAADMDGDGDLDVLVPNAGDEDAVRWLENDGDENFSPFLISDEDDPTIETIAVGDINGDENIDVVSTSFTDTSIRWHKNNGEGVFTTHLIFDMPSQPRSVVVADIDGDKDMDIVSASAGDNSIRWFENTGIDLDSDGGIGFTEHIIFTNALSVRQVAVADLDGDDDLDVLSASFSDASVRWYENTGREDGVNEGSVNFVTHLIHKSLENLGQTTFVATVDLNNDDKLDVLSSSFGFVRWYENDGSENFTDRAIDSDMSGGFGFLTSADIDGDTDIDVVAVAGAGSTIQILWYESNAASLNVEKVLPQTTTLYPNPTSSAVNLSYATATNTNYSLYDMSGRRLATYTQSDTAHQLDVSTVSKGTYILKAISGLQVNYYRIVKE